MALADSVRVRLSEGKARVYEAEAERLGVPVSTYLRDRLEQADRALDELGEIRAALADLGETIAELRAREPQGTSGTGEAEGVPGVAVETLLLLRTLAGPEKAKMVTAEVKRLGLATWEGKGAGNASGR